MTDKLYHVVVQRRSQAAAIQLNFTDSDRANAALAAIPQLAERRLFTDDFGSKCNFDPADIGHVLFIDAKKNTEFQIEVMAVQQVSQHRAGKRAQELVEKDIVVPRASLVVPQGAKFGM